MEGDLLLTPSRWLSSLPTSHCFLSRLLGFFPPLSHVVAEILPPSFSLNRCIDGIGTAGRAIFLCRHSGKVAATDWALAKISPLQDTNELAYEKPWLVS